MIQLNNNVLLPPNEAVSVILVAVNAIFEEKYRLTCIVTSINDGKHSGPQSLHHKGRAVDFRTKHIAFEEDKIRLRDYVRSALGQHFDVLLENLGKDNEHLHVEYDPKS